MSTYTEDHLVEQPAIQLMQHELGWDVGGNIEHPPLPRLRGTSRTPNIESRSEEMKMNRTPRLQRLNPDLPMDHSSPRLRMANAIDGAVEEILNDGSVAACGFAGTSCWILDGRERPQVMPLRNPDSGGG